MKRRSRVDFKDPFIKGVQQSHNRFDATTSTKNEDMKMVKRVRFKDPGSNSLPTFRPDSSSMQNQATQSPKYDLPKTSEYAFFKKVKNASSRSYPLKKNDNRNDAELTGCTKEIIDDSRQRYKDLRPSLPVKKSKPINDESFISPPAGSSKNSALTNMAYPTSEGIRSPLLVEKVELMSDCFLSSPFSCDAKNSGSQYSDKGVFSTRRRRLRQRISTSLPELDECCYKGIDLVNVLLSRLFPDDNEYNYRLDPHSKQVQIDMKLQLPSPDICVKESDWTCTRKSIESGYGSYLNDGFCRYRFDRPGDIVIPELDTMDSDYPSNSYTTKTRKPLIESSRSENDSFCGLWYPRYGSSSCQFKELDEFHELNRPVLRGEPSTLVLGWDSDEKEKWDPSGMSSNADINLFSALATSWGNYHPQDVHDRLSVSTPWSSSLSASNSLYSCLDNQTSHSRKYLKLMEEDFISDCTPKGRSITFCPQDQKWHMNQVYSEEECLLPHGLDQKWHMNQVYSEEECLLPRGLDQKWHMNQVYSEEECLLPRGLDFGLGSKCLSLKEYINHDEFKLPCSENCLSNSVLADEISEGTIHEWPIISFQEKEMGPSRALLLDNSSWLQSEEQTYDDDEDEWKYI